MGAYDFLSRIPDPHTRTAAKRMMDRIGKLEQQIADQGTVTKPFTGAVNAGGFHLQNLKNPIEKQDAVTLDYLRKYVANAFSAFNASEAAAGGGTGVPDPGKKFDDNIPDHGDVVATLAASHAIGPASTALEVFRFCQDVAWTLAGLGEDPLCGLLIAPAGGDNVYACGGITYRYNRVCYSNGHAFKILIDSDPGGARTPCWTDNGGVSVDLYHVATDPTSAC